MHIQFVLRRRHGQALRSLVQLVAADEHRRHIEVRCVLRLDRDIHRDAAAAALDHLPGVESVAFRRHQHRRRLFAGDDQHMRRVARLIGLLVGDNLHALLRRARSTTGSRPEPTGMQWSRPRDFSGVVALTRTRNSPASGMVSLTCALPLASVCPCVVVTDWPAPLRQSQRFISTRNARLHRLLVIVLRGDSDSRRAALGVNVRVRLGSQEEAAVGRERETVSRDLAVAGIGHARLDAIDQVPLLAVNFGRES